MGANLVINFLTLVFFIIYNYFCAAFKFDYKMNGLRLFLCSFALVAFSAGALASNFISTGPAESLFSFGIRTGVNTSNQTVSKHVFNEWNESNWGTGFTLGVVAPINFREFLSIEPGFFYESRSGNYTYGANNESEIYESGIIMEYGNYRLYNFVIPIMAKLNFNVTNKVVWSVEAGPYFSFRLNTTGKNMVVTDDGHKESDITFGTRKGFDSGLKLGTGLKFFRHLYVGVHFMAGGKHVWKEKELGGHNKEWTFTAGWDF